MANDVALTIAWDDLEAAELGPCMQALTRLQQRFVWAMVLTGGRDHTAACRLAGYAAKSENSLRVQAFRLAHQPEILAAIREVGKQRLQAHALMGAEILVQIADGMHGAKAADRLKAIDMIFGRAGMPQVTETLVIDATTRSDAEIMAELDKRLAQVGMKLAQFLPKPIDAEYTVVDDGKAGLEDLL